MIPGSNLLATALSVIGAPTVTYYRYAGRSRNEVGQYVTEVSQETRQGSVQAVSRNLYEQLGLDLQKNYVWFYAIGSTQDIGRDVSGDQFDFNGSRYEILSLTDWTPIDGWNGALAVQVDKA